MIQISRQNTMAPSIVFIVSFIGCIAIAHCVEVNLFGADPAGGLWGARVDTQRGSEATTTPSSGYKTRVFNKMINTASYDEVTKKVLFHTENPASLYYGPLCPANRKSPRFLTNLEVVPLHDTEMGDCVNCETSAFTTHNGMIYFLLFGEYMSSTHITRVVEIRSFVPCSECGDTGKKYKNEFIYMDVVKCSKLIVSVLKEGFMFIDFDDKEIKGAKSMKVIPKGDQLSFFFQLGNITRFDNAPDKVNMSLWYANTAGTIKELHSEALASRYSDWTMRALGSVDEKEGTVCWTAGDRLKCAVFADEMLGTVTPLISPGDAASSQVCKGPELDFMAMVSGVTITPPTGDSMSVIFGCYPQSKTTGGTGIVSIDKTGEISMQPVGTRDGPLLAGSVFLTSGFDESCTWKPKFKMCLGQPNPDGSPGPEPEEPIGEPTGEPEDGNEIENEGEGNPEPGWEEKEENSNGIEGGEENKGSEETKAVVGGDASNVNYCYFTLLSCLVTLSIAHLLS